MADPADIITIACLDPAAFNTHGSAHARPERAHPVPVSPAFEVRGVRLRAVLGAHETLEAACRDGAEPRWVQANAHDHPALAILARGEVEDFLFALTRDGQEWRDVRTGRALLELLPPALDDTAAELVASLARHRADLGPTGAFAAALARAPSREHHEASARTRHEWYDGSALVTFDVGVWHHAAHASWLPYAHAWWADEMETPARFATLRDGLEARYAQPNA